MKYYKSAKEAKEVRDAAATKAVADIICQVRQDKDQALKDLAEKFDHTKLTQIRVSKEDIEKAYSMVDDHVVESFRKAATQISFYAKEQLNCIKPLHVESPVKGVELGHRLIPVDGAGLYVPGGRFPLPSTALMLSIPAKIAGVNEIIMVTPPLKDGTPNKDILVAASLCGVDRVFMSGGAQAIAALAFGTEEIPKVDKIVGPGNIYVATAKKLLYGTVDIDMIAGPSEILVMADDTAEPKFVAADLMSQAEHDVIASAILVTTSERVADETVKEIDRQMQYLERKDIIEKSLTNYGAVMICETKDQAVEMANRYAPEHLEVLFENPMEYVGRLDNAGSVFLGSYASEPLGDYYAGPNHVLPTSGTARFFSPLGVNSFEKRSSFIYYTEDALREAKDDIVLVAEKEGLTAHANAIKVRFED